MCAPMEKLLAYIKTLTKEQRADFFKACKTTEAYVRKVASIGGMLGPAICVAVELESGAAVMREDLRSDWRDLWPELVNRQEAA